MDRRLYTSASALLDHVAGCLDTCSFGLRTVTPARPRRGNCDQLAVWVDPPTVIDATAPGCDRRWSVTYHVGLGEYCAQHPGTTNPPNGDAYTLAGWRHAGMVAEITRCLSCDSTPSFWCGDPSIDPGVWHWPMEPTACGSLGPAVTSIPTSEEQVGAHGVRWWTEWAFSVRWWPLCDCDPSPTPDDPPCPIV